MKKIIIKILLLFLLSGGVQASNIAGGEIWFRHLSSGFYRVYVTVYVDCSSSLIIPQTVPVYIKNTLNPSSSFTHNLNLDPSSGGVVSSLCPSATTTCDGGSIFGMRSYTYNAVVNIPSGKYRIIYSASFRNSLGNIVSSGQEMMSIFAYLNNTNSQTVSSPAFNTATSVYLCEGLPGLIMNRAGEECEDSLAYSLVPLRGNNSHTYLPYANGFSHLEPFGDASIFSFDESNGDISVTPFTSMTAGYAINVDKYEMLAGVWVKTSSSMRDFQAHVNNCNNQLPSLSGINPAATQYNPGDTVYDITVCAGDEVSFNIFAYDPPDVNNPVFNNMTISWANHFSGPSFYAWNQNTANPVGYFTWKPTNIDAAKSPFLIKMSVTDNSCPFPGTKQYTYRISVLPRPIVSLGGDVYAFQDENITVNANTNELSGMLFYWRLNGSMLHLPLSSSSVNINTSGLPTGLHQLSVRAIHPDQTHCDGHDTIAIYIRPLHAAGVSDAGDGQTSLNVFPVPISNSGNVSVSLSAKTNVRCFIIDVYGRKVRDIYQGNLTAGEHTYELSELGSLPRGTYMVMLQTTETTVSKRIIIQ